LYLNQHKPAELNKTILSNEHVLAKIDEYQALLEPEVPRNHEYWKIGLSSWYGHVDLLREFITDSNYELHNIQNICLIFQLSDEERMEWFGR